MKAKLLLTSAVLLGLAAPAFADDGFFIVQGSDKHCTIVDKKPVDTTTTVVSPSGTVYKTRTEAESGMKTVKVCSSN